ncbi:5-carboxymethyl-2-oxo-hex-3- ene-1 7-dioate decarboxylase / 2-hydroxyhepta-2 4-diene-1 7-dioate isomerase [Paramagnetospirillum magnetotacticum MS-1]|uniref:5-carboxymethyl-2-oxo-hex-3-ene-1 7-dioate decarboxylase / 2-hydroxyhepta-2 4-diene-1 7-dioate isomerase n=1 Tax=Paramagnetospirillum magnetotacticum MS-1 TaxID=272627 RepID=A0A0C2YHL4_PARME|nr:fumarylacetoacetate hydrolase family protein [Paramagnetospirillum magnetotacticum]KIL99214.1 5-carboxymethyl-2-oxo-hex-3- ene-1 7-dioate decarboxylase / 2-hydroxyhepta-2 4-diene-1 7-dioate isomerase [Paramagnetospirillum magnetotacticum MS-1]
MRIARINLPGASAPTSGAVTPDGTSLDLGGRRLAIAEGSFAPAVTGWIYGPLLNEVSTMERFGERLNADPYKAPPTVPVLYFKPKNTHLGHGGRVRLPAYAERVELGASVGLVFKRQTARANPETALDTVGGYTIVLDLSVPNDSVYRPPVQEKCFDGACPVGPWVVDKAEIADPHNLVIKTFVNGELKAERRLDSLVRPAPQLVADVTAFMNLGQGDVLTLGYPVGAVPTAGRGDHVRIEIEGLGALECTIEEGAA